MDDWFSRLRSIEFDYQYNRRKKFELYKFLDEKFVGVSYTKVRDEIERDLDISDITAVDLQDDIIGSIIVDEYREQVPQRMKDEHYMNILSI